MSSNGEPKKYPKVSQIFTDEDGEKFEWVTYSDIAGELCSKPLGVLKPVKAEPEKWSYSLRWESNDKLPPDYFIDQEFKLTEDQAQLIKEAVEALMEYINRPLVGEDGVYSLAEVTQDLQTAADKVRQVMKENQG